MVSALFSGASGPVSSTAGWGHCVVFLNKTHFFTQCLSPPRWVPASEFNAGDNFAIDYHPIQGGVEIFLVASIILQKPG